MISVGHVKKKYGTWLKKILVNVRSIKYWVLTKTHKRGGYVT